MWLQAYDQHMNMILGDVEETITTVEIDDETYEEIIKVRYASHALMRQRLGHPLSTDFNLDLLSFLPPSDAKTHGAFPVC